MSKYYVFPSINGRQLYGNVGFEFDESTAKVSFYLFEDNIEIFHEIIESPAISVECIIGDKCYGLFPRATSKITKLESNIDELTYLEITFNKAS